LAKLPSPSSPSNQSREGGRWLGHGRPAAIPGGPGRGNGREVGENGEGFKGIRFPYLPWAEMVCGGGSSGGGGLEVAVLGVAAL
jgi:hypothetical protein